MKKELSANDIELMLNENNLYYFFGNSMEYAALTRPLNKRYSEVTGNGIMFDLTRSYPPMKDRFICLLKAIENKKDVEYYYSEYWKNKISKDAKDSNRSDDILF